MKSSKEHLEHFCYKINFMHFKIFTVPFIFFVVVLLIVDFRVKKLHVIIILRKVSRKIYLSRLFSRTE